MIITVHTHTHTHILMIEDLQNLDIPDATQAPLLAEQKVYQSQPKKGSDHRHPNYNYPEFIKLEDDQQFPPEFVWDYKNAVAT